MPLELKHLRLLGEVCLLSQMLLALELEKTLKSIREMNSEASLREQQIQTVKDSFYSMVQEVPKPDVIKSVCIIAGTNSGRFRRERDE